jgi:subtilisin
MGTRSVGAGGRAVTTGRYLLVLGEDLLGDDDAARAAVRELSGAKEVTSTRDAERGAAARTHPTLFAELGLAVVDLSEAQLSAARTDRRLLGVEPERVQRAIGGPLFGGPHLGGSLSEEYLRGFRDAAQFLHSQVAGAAGAAAPRSSATPTN